MSKNYAVLVTMYSLHSTTVKQIKPLLTWSSSSEQLSLTERHLKSSGFQAITCSVPDHAGIIICTEDPNRIRQAQRVVEAIAKASGLRRQLIRVYRGE